MAIDRLAFEFDPLKGFQIPEDRQDEAREQIAEYVRDKVLEYISEGKSPVAGGQWKKALSPDYKKRKGEISSVGFANLELNGDMLDALEVVEVKGKLALQITGNEAAKADGHNNFSGKSKLPPRQFIPNKAKGQNFKREILVGIREIAADYEEFEEIAIEQRQRRVG